MKFSKHSQFIYLITRLRTGNIIFLIGLLLFSVIQAQPKVNLNQLSTSKLFDYREKFINNFQRSGLNTTPGDAKLLRILVASARCKRGIEVGSATGFGAINMGMEFEFNGGQLFTIDIDSEMVSICQKNIKAMGLQKTVTCILGDALTEMPKLSGKFDFLFIDAVKSDYYKYFKAIESKLLPGAVIVADNVICSARAMKNFLDFIEKDPNYDMVIIQASQEKRDGMAVIYKKK